MAARPLRTRIGMVNMATVIKNYRKAQEFQTLLINQAKGLDQQYLEPLRTQIAKLQKEYQDPATPPAKREQIERDLRQLQLQFREREEDARKQMDAKQSEWTVQLYREIEDMVRGFAGANDLELVLFYTDPTNPTNPYDQNVIKNRLSIRGCVPMYMAPGMDISDAITSALNAKLGPAAPPAGPTAGTGSAQPAAHN
jgi:Skp family chaperone for outer membrane proteins